ncbi:Altered inheritance of mitochondria protein 6 [Aspergillus nanangensis]|uniref:Altered inheritance of mitochondria protein 6 n=1 Tax=Aspergillus nanangensis TaxID=2582783 RepID=A0AAD4CU10_ASPNN|nr:Altered inheritance of mitochondria protein 6 [Aspergillus nanangensis]
MSSLSPSHFPNTTTSSPMLLSTSRPDYRDGADYEAPSDRSDYHLSVNDSVSDLDSEHHIPLTQSGRKSLWRQGLAAIYPGIVQFVAIVCGIIISFFPDDFTRATNRWHRPHDEPSDDILRWPTDISRDIMPVACHSHNDYWRTVPLFSALQAGCVGIEADVWLFDGELYVGHTTSSLTHKRTLSRMYIEPLVKILGQQNPMTQFHTTADQPPQGVFDTDPSQSVILLIDFKTDGVATWKHVTAQLSPLRERGYLSYFNGTDIVQGPVTVVGTGNTPFNLVTANATYRDIFFDAPLEMMTEDYTRGETPRVMAMRSAENAGQGLSGVPKTEIVSGPFNWTNSYYASVSFRKAIGFPWSFHLTDRQIGRIRAQIRGAHRRGLKVRYWSLPSWPRSLRNHLWSVLVHEGVDMLNVDDLQAAAQKDWSPKVSDWWGLR